MPCITSDESITSLMAGVSRFQREVYPLRQAAYRQATRDGKRPHTMFVTCSDFAMDPELITQSEPGEILVIRNVGHLIPAHRKRYDSVSAIIEHAVVCLRVNHLVVCGHSNCGAVAGMLQPRAMEQLPITKFWLRNGEAALRMVRNYGLATDESRILDELIEENVLLQMHNLRTHPSVAGRLRDGSVGISGWVYDSAQGIVRAFDKGLRKFIPVGCERDSSLTDHEDIGDNRELVLQAGASNLDACPPHWGR